MAKSKQAKRDEAYAAIGDIQAYYRSHEVAEGSLYKDVYGQPRQNPNGEASACIWGAIIATGHGTKQQYTWRDQTTPVVEALEATLREINGGYYTTVVSYNDGVIQGDKTVMRSWLRKARSLLKSGSIL